MKLVSVLSEGRRFAGLLEGEEVFVTGVTGVEAAIAGNIALKRQPGRWERLGSVTLDVPLRPGALFCTGSNYKDHLDERMIPTQGIDASKKELEFFLKAGQTIASLEEPLRLD